MLKNKKILVGVTGSIAAYKACDLVQRLKEQGASVRVLMTASATRIIHPNALAALSGAPVITDAWDNVAQGKIPHIEAARWADLFVVAPCTAHTLAELSLGLTGSPVSMTALACAAPLAVAPAMNTVMLESEPVREHLQRLQARGVHLLPTLGGNLACGEVGEGKLTTPEEIASYADLILEFGGPAPSLRGKRVVIAGGHTEEPLDAVRFLSNRSSGKTALAIARAFRLSGADVQLVLGRADEELPNGISVTQVRSSADFRDAMLALRDGADAVVMAAAIADFRPVEPGTGKWKASRDRSSLALEPVPNILEELGRTKPEGQVLVGFALETETPLGHALDKMKSRNCDLMVVNTPLSLPGHGFGHDAVEAALLDARSPEASPALRVMRKAELAVGLVRRVAAVSGAGT